MSRLVDISFAFSNLSAIGITDDAAMNAAGLGTASRLASETERLEGSLSGRPLPSTLTFQTTLPAVRYALPPERVHAGAGDTSDRGVSPAGEDRVAQPYEIDFLSLGIPLAGGPRPVTTAGANNATYYCHRYRKQAKLLLPAPESLYVQALDRVAKAVGIPPGHLSLFVVKDDAPNAWIVNGTGAIFVTTGLLKKPGLTVGELITVLGHEVGHYLMKETRAEVPKRFRNPLFREMVLATHAARSQSEEYDADEVGLLIADAAGVSVDEALSMDRWLAGRAEERFGGRTLRPGQSHPYGAARAGVTARALEDTRFVWHNRGVPGESLAFDDKALMPPETVPVTVKSMIRFTKAFFDGDERAPAKQDSAKYYRGLSLRDPEVVRKIALFPDYLDEILDEGNSVSLLFDAFRKKDIQPGPEAAQIIQRLRSEAQDGGMIARALFHVVMNKIFFEAVRKEDVKSVFSWIEKDCQVSSDEVLVSLIAYTESFEKTNEKKFIDFETLATGRPPTWKMTLDAVISPFPRSAIRDRWIGLLLSFPEMIGNRDEYIESGGGVPEGLALGRNSVLRLPLVMAHIALEKVDDLMQKFYGTSFVALDGILEIEDSEGPRYDYFTNEFDSGWRVIDHKTLLRLLSYLYVSAGAYDRGWLEAVLAESRDEISMFFQDDLLTTSSVLYEVRDSYEKFKTRAAQFEDAVLSERLLTVGRLVVLRHLEVLPVEDWNDKTIRMIEGMAPSTEKNHLLLILDAAGRRKADRAELVWREIPSPDAPDSLGESLHLVNSFGFINAQAAEAIYPSGQRALDRHVAGEFPKTGPLLLLDIVREIPRASPLRDELLDRCEARDIEQATSLLDRYWSPAAAYAKASEISNLWRDASQGRLGVLTDICEITREFPSLKRKMILAWVDRFGIREEDYARLLQSTRDVDVVDLYRGGLIEHTRQTSSLARAAVCLASFGLALLRSGHSLLSIESLTKETGRDEKKKSRVDREVEKLKRADEPEKTALLQRLSLFDDYHPLLPETALDIARLLWEGGRTSTHRIPFIDGRAAPNPRFQRDRVVKKGLDELARWEGGQVFFNFMRAMGWEEASGFFEQLLMGEGGVMRDRKLFEKMENIFLEGIGLLLEEKGVPLTRVKSVRDGLRSLLAYQPDDIRGRVWARILAGIAQQQTLGEIVREAVKPLGAPGAKLMQAIHSLTVGVDATLEEATRLSLDQSAQFTLFDILQFLGSREARPFGRHDAWSLLGQGSERAAARGSHGSLEDSAYLVVHASAADRRVVEGIEAFIRQALDDGQYFPLTPAQFRQLVFQTEQERTQGFENHERFRTVHGGRLGGMRIPNVLEKSADWARLELADGLPYAALTAGQQAAAAPAVIGGAMAQFGGDEERPCLINPELHGGNILYDSRTGALWLVDCGLVGEASREDLRVLMTISSGFAAHGLTGAVSALLRHKGVSDLASLEDSRRARLLSGLKILDQQVQSGTAPELLLSGVATLVSQSTGQPVEPGLELLIRGLQHLAPYFRKVSVPFAAPAASDERDMLAEEIRSSMASDASSAVKKLPRGIAVGKARPGGSVVTVGVLVSEIDLDAVEKEGSVQGMLKCVLEGGVKQYVRPSDLRIQAVEGGQTRWVSLEEWTGQRQELMLTKTRLP